MTDDLKFAGKLPVVINRNGDTKDVFTPIRSSSCDITIVSNKILSDLYTNDKKGIKVKVEKLTGDEQIQLFEGYLTPNSYSQKLSPNLDNIDMTAIDPLAVLKYLYIDDMLEKAKTISMGEMIGKALALVKIDCNEVQIEDTVMYNEDDGYQFVNLMIQTNNFWDEADDPSNVYDAVSECLRLFGYTLTFTGDKYMIYLSVADHNFGITYRYFNRYIIEDGGTLRNIGECQINKSDYFFTHSAGDWTTIDDNTTVSIDDTYDKIVSVASTKIPNYSLTAFDFVSSDNRDLYDVGDLNVATNKIKGYMIDYSEGLKLITDDKWYYIWNGVYINPDYNLNIEGVGVNGFANINGAYEYLSGEQGHPTASGSILNFYGGEMNPKGTGRDQYEERAVEVKECITVFAPDNGTPPEFLEREDLGWSYTINTNPDLNSEVAPESDASFIKIDGVSAKFGTNKTGVEGISYKQKYENLTISSLAEQTLVIDMSQSYSRTGFNNSISILDNSDIENKIFGFGSISSGEESFESYSYLKRGTAYKYPSTWQNENVSVSFGYFNKYASHGSNSDAALTAVWDIRPIVLFITLSDGTKYQFNGKEWVQTENITNTNTFYLKKLMNYKNIFTDEFTYDLIQCSDGEVYSLNPNGFTYYTDNNGGVYAEGVQKGTEHTFNYYGSSGVWKKYIDEADEGRLAIILPAIDDINCTVECDIYHSNLLGTTGNSSYEGPGNISYIIYYSKTGKVEYIDEWGNTTYREMDSSWIDDYGAVYGIPVEILYLPINATYIKAEHLNLDISLSVPESNLGQMFGESDIRYSTNHSKKFRESFDAPSFKVNTKHPIVSQSHSYVIGGKSIADANKFSMGWSDNKIACRPENYVMQGYKNFYSVIRRNYNRVLVPNKQGFSNCMCYIEAPDIPDTGHGRWLMVMSDSYDVKTNRHTISAVEDYNLTVNEIENYTVLEIPREARNPRYNLQSVKKRKS